MSKEKLPGSGRRAFCLTPTPISAANNANSDSKMTVLGTLPKSTSITLQISGLGVQGAATQPSGSSPSSVFRPFRTSEVRNSSSLPPELTGSSRLELVLQKIPKEGQSSCLNSELDLQYNSQMIPLEGHQDVMHASHSSNLSVLDPNEKIPKEGQLTVQLENNVSNNSLPEIELPSAGSAPAIPVENVVLGIAESDEPGSGTELDNAKKRSSDASASFQQPRSGPNILTNPPENNPNPEPTPAEAYRVAPPSQTAQTSKTVPTNTPQLQGVWAMNSAITGRTSKSRGYKLSFQKSGEGDVVKASKSDCLSLEEAWGYALVGFVVGRFPGFQIIGKLKENWPKHEFNAQGGWFMFKFFNEDDRDSVMMQGPFTGPGYTLLLKCVPEVYFRQGSIL